MKVGDRLPEFVRTAGFAAWNRFAAVNDEFVPIHMDPEAGKAAGYPGAIGMGFLHWAYMHAVVRAWLEGAGAITRMSCRFKGPSLAGTSAAAGGQVTAVSHEGDVVVVELDMWVRDGDGRDLTAGRATVELRA